MKSVTFNSHSDRMIKVCGMRSPRNIREVASLSPMLMGFIFHAPSPRCAAALPEGALAALPPFVTPVGVFVDAPADVVRVTCRRHGIATVQLHGHETPDFCAALADQGLTVLKAVGISADTPDWQALRPYEPYVTMFVFDTKCPSGGGSGRKYPWSVLDSYPLSTPYLLSGGIGPEDASAVIDAMRPLMAGIDLNSRFESAPGEKDVVRLATFMSQLKNLNENEPPATPFWKKA